MLLAIMSDSHDNIWNMRKAVSIIREQRAAQIIHCGDFVAPFMLKELEQAQIPVHGVFGNNDGDKYLLMKLSIVELQNITIYGQTGAIAAGGIRIGFAHERIKADGLLFQGGYDLVCFGHTHAFMTESIHRTTLLNPGEIMGKDGEPGFVFYETDSGDIERIRLS